MHTFIEKLARSTARAGTNLCIGLDPDPEKMPAAFQALRDPADRMAAFCRQVVDLTRPHAAAYKPNLAFFEALGAPAFEVFTDVVRHIGPDIPVIADAKRGDIGNTARMYRTAFFDTMGVDAITLNPWMGVETIEPYLDAPGKAVYVLVLTSNPGATDFMLHYDDGKTLALQLAETLEMTQEKSSAHIGMVLGATRPHLMAEILEAHSNGSALVPGFGAQGGDAEAVKRMFRTHGAPPVFNVSRDILFPQDQSAGWADAVSAAAARWAARLDLRAES